MGRAPNLTAPSPCHNTPFRIHFELPEVEDEEGTAVRPEAHVNWTRQAVSYHRMEGPITWVNACD
jgi:hypothetical protein